MIVMKHIEVHELSGRCVLAVHDAELFDYLEDFFTESGVVADVVFPSKDQEPYQLWFPSGMSEATVLRHLAQVSTAQVERIVSVNGDGSVLPGAT